MTSTLTKQLVHAYWHILEDFPSKDGEYVVVFATDDGTFGYPDVWEFTARDGWQPLFGIGHEHQPTHWCNLPMPK
jgi:hypothetical protein